MPRYKTAKWCWEMPKDELGHLRVSELTLERFKRWIDKKANEYIKYGKNQKPENRRKRKPATLNQYIATCKAALNFAVRYGRLNSNPLAFFPKKKVNNVRDRIIDPVEFNRIMNQAPEYFRPLLQFFYLIPCRKMELLQLRYPQDLDLFNRVLIIRDGTTKIGDGRQRGPE
ncbi:MAG: hypothetical protein ABIA63_03045 [bacterium]